MHLFRSSPQQRQASLSRIHEGNSSNIQAASMSSSLSKRNSSCRRITPPSHELVEPTVSVRAFLVGGDDWDDERRNRRKNHSHRHQRHFSISSKSSRVIDNSECDPFAPSVSSLSVLSSSSINSDEIYERFRQRRQEHVRDILLKAIKDQENQINDLTKLIEQKQAIVNLHLQSGNEFGAVVVMKQILKSESRRDKTIHATVELCRLRQSLDDLDNDVDEGTYPMLIESILASTASPNVAWRGNDDLLSLAKARFQACAIHQHGEEI